MRLNDFEVGVGDTLLLEEWDPKTEKYTGRKIEKKVSFVLKFNPNDFSQEDVIKGKGLILPQLD